MKKDLPPACDFQKSLTVNCELTWPYIECVYQGHFQADFDMLNFTMPQRSDPSPSLTSY